MWRGCSRAGGTQTGSTAGSSVGIAGGGVRLCCASRQSSWCWVMLLEHMGFDEVLEARRGDPAGEMF